MSITAQPVHGPIERRWQHRRPTARRPAAAVLTSVAVLVGCVLALVLVPPPNTPFHIAEAYVQARVEEDANAAWMLLCPDVRQRVTFAAFIAWMEELNRIAGMPSEVSVTFDGITGGPSDRLISVSLTLTTSERPGWSSSGEVLVEQQGTEFYICDDAVSPLL